MELAITTERAGDKGWVAFAAEVRATAQGSTEAEAKQIERYARQHKVTVGKFLRVAARIIIGAQPATPPTS